MDIEFDYKGDPIGCHITHCKYVEEVAYIYCDFLLMYVGFFRLMSLFIDNLLVRLLISTVRGNKLTNQDCRFPFGQAPHSNFTS